VPRGTGAVFVEAMEGRDVVEHYNDFLRLGLTEQQKSDLVEYLKSL
jgi:hypothetical protein